jgi:hypothetical protein
MRRDYFTCVFLGLIAGALAFVCFSPLYFTYEGIIPRDFTIFERCMSFLYAVFFVLFLPCYAAFKKKEWINWGLAAYGVLIYLPLWFYPAEKLATADPGLLTKFGALILRTIYNVMEAPFAALSKLLGNTAAPKVVYWILPLAIFWPVVFRIVRFYRLAYLSEQLNPMTPDQAAPSKKVPEAPGKPEVLGTVISAPVTAQTPADITRKNIPAFNGEETAKLPPVQSPEKPAMREGPKAKPRAGVRAPVRPVHLGVEAPVKEPAAALGAGAGAEKKESKPAGSEAIELGAPKPKSDEAIPMPPPKPKADEAIPLGAPVKKPDDVIILGGPGPENGGE